MKKLVLVLSLLLAAPVLIPAAPAFAQTDTAAPAPSTAPGPATPMTPAPDDRAKQWLQLVDDNNYADAYKQMAVSAQDRKAADPWTQQVSTERTPLGAMASRTIRTVKLTKTLPGMRDGQYATVQFDSSFAHKAAAVETVVLTSEKGGWSVIGYSLN